MMKTCKFTLESILGKVSPPIIPPKNLKESRPVPETKVRPGTIFSIQCLSLFIIIQVFYSSSAQIGRLIETSRKVWRPDPSTSRAANPRYTPLHPLYQLLTTAGR